MKRFAVQVAQRSCIGARSRNEDRLAVEHYGGYWCLALSDGAGGHDDGAARLSTGATSRSCCSMRTTPCWRDSASAR